MKTTSACVIVGCFTTRNINHFLFQLLREKQIRLGPGQDFLKSLTSWPMEKNPTRRELCVFSTNNPEPHSRPANFYELCGFAVKYPTFAEEVGNIECFDKSVYEMSKDIGVHLAIPVFGIYNDEPCIYLRDKNARASEFGLGII